MTHRKVLVLGLDCVDLELVQQWCDEGSLPVFEHLRKTQGITRVSSTAEIMHVSAWPSLHTGTTPGHHGMYHAYQVRAGNQNILRTRPDFCAREPFWRYLDNAGRRCIIFDAFMDSPLADFGGSQIREYGTWTWFGEPGSSPDGLLRQMKDELGAYPGPEHSKVVTVPDAKWFRDVLVAAANRKGEAINWLLRSKEWDLAFATINEGHGAAHYLWHLADPDYPVFVDSIHHAALREVYVAIDQAIGNVISTLNDCTDIIIISCDGMGPNYSGCHLMPELLNKLALFHSTTVGPRNNGDSSQTASKTKSGLLSQIRQAIPLEVRQSLTQRMPRDLRYKLSMRWANSGIDWSRTKVFCIPNNNEAYFRINLMGREPQGIVASGEEANKLTSYLVDEFRSMTNPETNQPAARSVIRMDQTFDGPERKHLPDLVVTWNNEARISDRIKTISAGIVQAGQSYDFAPHYTGNHRPNAFAILRGPSLATSSLASGGAITDIAPTVFDILGVDLPFHFEGRSWLRH